MGRSLNSCFKIMSCAGDSAKNDDDLPQSESKTSPGKHRWSFQKRSAMHRVPSNNVISESMPIMNNKQNQAASADTVNSEKASVSQKATVGEQTNEISTLPLAVVPSRESEQVTDKSTVKVDYNIQEDVVVVVQASIRGYLAKRELEKIKNVVKLQASIRRYLVRRQAVGTLRCMLAIVKIQQLIRAHLSIRSTGFIAKEKLNEEMKAVKVKSFEMKLIKTPPVIRSLASNAFANQLLKSTLETKPIHISCNPLQPDSGWIWLERWMALTSSDRKKEQDDLGEGINTDQDAYEVNNKLQVTQEHISSDSKFAPSDPAGPAAVEVDLTNSSEKIEVDVPVPIQEQCSDSPVQNDQLDSYIEEAMSIEKEEYTTGAMVEESSDSIQSQTLLSSDAVSEFALDGTSNKPDYSEETNKNGAKKEFHEIPEMEIGQVVIESRKSRNPGFAAVQAKFEELSSASSSNRSLNHASKDSKSDSKSVQSQLGSNLEEVSETKSVNFQVVGTKFKEVRLAENFTGHTPINQVATLELRKDISTTSIPERSEAGLSEIVPEIRTSNGKFCIVGSSTNLNNGDMAAETDDLSSDSNEVQRQIMAKSSENATRAINTAEPVQLKKQSAESITSNTQVADSAKGPQVSRSSQEGSPRSHIIVAESHGTPSSQISIDAKSIKAENSMPVRKRRSQLLVNSSPTNSKNESGAQTSGELLKKETKSAKRRNSFSMVKTDHVDHEHQTSNSSLLPSYMQPTESARAKVNTSISQKSSLDIHDKDNHIKKRHSLPNGDGKQGSSPRMQRSTSQVQQNMKGNGIHSPPNSSERRWLR